MISDTIVSVFNKAWGLTWRRQRSRSSSQVIQYITCYSFHPHDCYYLFHTFYSKRTHSIVEEHILYPRNYTIMFSQVRSRSCLLPVWLGCVYVCAGETYLNKLPRHWEEALQKLGFIMGNIFYIIENTYDVQRIERKLARNEIWRQSICIYLYIYLCISFPIYIYVYVYVYI